MKNLWINIAVLAFVLIILSISGCIGGSLPAVRKGDPDRFNREYGPIY